MKLLYKYIYIIIGVIVFIQFTSCKKFVEVDPPTTALVNATIFKNDLTAASAVNGILENMYYGGFNTSYGGGSYGITALLGLSSDEFTLFDYNNPIYSGTYINFVDKNGFPWLWIQSYNLIYQANAALEGLNHSSGTTKAIQQQLIGEVKFIRAFCYFYLVNTYGNVPLVLTTDYRINSLIIRSSKTQVYAQIIEDLKEAQGLLSINYLTSTGTNTVDRVRPNMGAATALLARVYLYTGDWVSASTQSTSVISNTVGSYLLVPKSNINNVFLKGSTEAIWQLEVPNLGGNTADGDFFLLPELGGPSSTYPVSLSESLVNSFESGDERKSNWIGSFAAPSGVYYYPNKYQYSYTGAAPVEYPILLRLAEQYLIRAEAKAYQNDILGATNDLNVIRNRAGLANLSNSLTQPQILEAIAKERRIELFSEYGHRWLDLKRTGKVDQVMTIYTPIKGGIWNTNYQLYPIPEADIQKNTNLTQNPGYN